MNNTISQQLASLFDEWRQRLVQNGDGTNFNEDGVMFQNGIQHDETEQKWTSSDTRVLFLLKEQNESNNEKDRGGCDIRYFLTDTDWTPNAAKVRNLEFDHYKNIAYMLWGLHKADKDNDWQYNDVAAHHEEVKEFFNTCPFAMIECKKVSGGGECDNKVLKRHLNTYGDLLKKEIELLNPTIIVCTHRSIYDFVLNMYPASELMNIDERFGIKYHKGSNVLILGTYHPSQINKQKYSNEVVYNSAMDNYRVFLKWKANNK